MNIDEISECLLGNDETKIRDGSHAIRRLNDRAALRVLAGQILPKRAQLEDLDLGGHFFPNLHFVQVAIAKLEFSLGDQCFCELYSLCEFYNPDEEQSADNISIDKGTSDAATWSTDYVCRCESCGQRFEVHGNAGWHRPWWHWVAADL